MNRLRPLVSVALVAVLSACATMEPPPLLPADVPAAWQGPRFNEADVWPNTDWWSNFKDAELSAYIDAVKANNLDLANNRRNLESAQLTLVEGRLARWPTPQVSIGDGVGFVSNRADGSTVFSGNTPEDTQLSASAIYGSILTKPATYARALTDYDSDLAQAADLAMNTLATATSTYFQLLVIRDQIVAAQQNLENAEVIGRIAQARLDAGVSTPIEALQQQIQIEQQRINLRSLLQSDLAARASLAILVGRHLQGFDIAGQTLQNVEVPRVQPGLPSELLVRRPDLYQSELGLRSAAINVTIARRSLFPQISLTGTGSASTPSLADLVSSPAGTSFSISAGLVQTLLDNGARQRNIQSARIAVETSLANYRRTVLGAFNEVELALSNIELLEAQADVAASSLAAAEESFRIAQVRYEEGVTDFQTVLQSQNTLFSTRNSFYNTKLQRLNAVVNFYQALGGGWSPGDIPAYWGVDERVTAGRR
ncbi:MAG TPA: TolC family protein [Gammaproteobacteria bacterium]|nr:TolC family protein [Gammaproteobacteria bacterium]